MRAREGSSGLSRGALAIGDVANQGPTQSCTFSDTFEEDGQVLTVSGTVQVIVRP
jgi:hypothetical protein